MMHGDVRFTSGKLGVVCAGTRVCEGGPGLAPGFTYPWAPHMEDAHGLPEVISTCKHRVPAPKFNGEEHRQSL